MEEKLDNPVWHSLSETHNRLSIGNERVKFYHPDYCPFGGFSSNENILSAIEEYATLTGNFFIVGERPSLPSSLTVKKELVCDQMIITQKIDEMITAEIIQLDEQYRQELFDLVNLVQPGYFKSKTAELGYYYGILHNSKLVAVTGERMQMGDYIEVSAVVTHPDFTGKGLAKQLVAHTVNNIFQQSKIPFLHVAETNTGAIALYKKLNFITRRKISFWNLMKK